MTLSALGRPASDDRFDHTTLAFPASGCNPLEQKLFVELLSNIPPFRRKGNSSEVLAEKLYLNAYIDCNGGSQTSSWRRPKPCNHYVCGEFGALPGPCRRRRHGGGSVLVVFVEDFVQCAQPMWWVWTWYHIPTDLPPPLSVYDSPPFVCSSSFDAPLESPHRASAAVPRKGFAAPCPPGGNP